MKSRTAACPFAPPKMRAMSACRAAFTGAFHCSTAGSERQEVMPCGTPRAPPRM